MADTRPIRARFAERAAYAAFSLNSFVAAMIALYIGFSIGLPRPYWAMLTVYITSQPLTGALRSKALYRVIGTTVGGGAAVLIVPTFVDSPIIMSLAMASWSGLCLYFSLLDRTPRAYIFMLAGYTAAIIGFPSVNAPGAIFDTALARVEEITLGIACATVVHTIVFPKDVGAVLKSRIARFVEDGETWIREALQNDNATMDQKDRRRLAGDLTELHITATHLPFDTAHLPLRTIAVHALENRLAYMLPLISAVEDRLRELGDRPLALQRLLADLVVWTAAEDSPEQQRAGADALTERAEAMMPVVAPGAASWDALLTISILKRLQELILALQDSRDLARLPLTPAARAAPAVRGLLRGVRRRLHLDPGMAALSGASLMAAVLICCALWILTAWPDGFVAAMMAAVFSSFFAAQDDPAPAIASFLTWTLASIPLGALYLFLLLPAIDGFPMLALVLSPALLVIGYFQATPRWSPAAMAMILGFAGGIALQPVFSADLPEYLDSNLAECIGVGVALACARVLRSVGAGWAAKRILRQGWREIAALARRKRAADPERWIGAMLDRVGLVNARLALAAPEDELEAYDALSDMRVGMNVIALRETAADLTGQPCAPIDAALDGVAALFAARSADGALVPPKTLLTTIDEAISALSRRSGDPAPTQGFAALAGLRRNLFPEASPYGAAGTGRQ